MVYKKDFLFCLEDKKCWSKIAWQKNNSRLAKYKLFSLLCLCWVVIAVLQREWFYPSNQNTFIPFFYLRDWYIKRIIFLDGRKSVKQQSKKIQKHFFFVFISNLVWSKASVVPKLISLFCVRLILGMVCLLVSSL